MEFKFFIGIDISKKCLDFSVFRQNQQLFHIQVENCKSGITQIFKKLKTYEVDLSYTVFCMEHTGIYKNHLLDLLVRKNAHIWLETPMRIKHSLGMQRGKNDKIDSYRIGLYAFKNRDSIKLWQSPRKEIKKLQYLITLRARLVSIEQQLKTPIKEAKGFVEKDLVNIEGKICKIIIESTKKSLAQVNKLIKEHIKQDQELNRLYNLITSIDGIGEVVAINTIVSTNEFKDFDNPKKFACYAGVVPFEHRSGTSIRGRSRVSQMANKSIKTLFHMAALSSIQMQGELRDYYLRKVEDGKNKMMVLNAIRNKLILRIFAVVKNNRKYEKIYVNAFA